MSNKAEANTMKDDRKRELKPKLRFPEFRAAPNWREKSLEEVLSPIVRERKKPVDAYTGLGMRSHGKGTFLKNLANPEKNSMEYLYEVQCDDLIVNITFAWEGAIAIAKPTDTGALVSHRFPTYVFKRDSAIPGFFRYIILDKQFVYKLGVISPGGAGRNRVLNKNDFLKLRVILPEVSEQQKVADCLTNLDELIAAHGQKLDALKSHKNGLMQQLFPCEGETLPRLRFPDFQADENWKEIELGQLGKTVSGLTYAPKDVTDSGLLVLRSSNVQDGRITLDDCVYVTPDIKGANLSKPNDILICVRNGSTSLIGKNAIIPKGMPLCTHGAFMTIFRSEAPKFVYQLLQTQAYKTQVAADLGARINSINNSQLINYKFWIPPTVAELEKVAYCLSFLDELIAAQTQKLEALKTHKKGLMQQLLPSPEEVEA
jgi:type I restriction enzyme S subunit